jgi:hypothetical protein
VSTKPGQAHVQSDPGIMADEADLIFNQMGLKMIHQGPTESRDVPFLGPPPAPGQPWLGDSLTYDPPNVIPQYFSRAAFGGGHLATVLVHRLDGNQGGYYSAETELCFMGYDKWWAPTGAPPYPYWGGNPGKQLTPDSLGRDYTRPRVFAHEIGHALLPIRNRPGGGEENLPPRNGWAGGHDFGPVPKETDALMRRSGTKGKWLRHEDWDVAVEEAMSRMGL